jgi:beta-mannosidase
VSEFGAQSVPTTNEFCEPERWPDLDWERLSDHFGMQHAVFEQRIPPAAFETFDDWVAASQQYQARLLRHHIETLRRLKYRPTGGFCFFQFADAQPAISWSVLDHQRVPKAAYDAVVEACRPVIVVADMMAVTVNPGDALALELHVVSDLRRNITDGTITARLAWNNGEHTWRFGGRIDADSCGRVGMVRFVVPAAPGPLALDLTLEAGDVAATNRYTTTIEA